MQLLTSQPVRRRQGRVRPRPETAPRLATMTKSSSSLTTTMTLVRAGMDRETEKAQTQVEPKVSRVLASLCRAESLLRGRTQAMTRPIRSDSAAKGRGNVSNMRQGCAHDHQSVLTGFLPIVSPPGRNPDGRDGGLLVLGCTVNPHIESGCKEYLKIPVAKKASDAWGGFFGANGASSTKKASGGAGPSSVTGNLRSVRARRPVTSTDELGLTLIRPV